jgi:hypothetical protein
MDTKQLLTRLRASICSPPHTEEDGKKIIPSETVASLTSSSSSSATSRAAPTSSSTSSSGGDESKTDATTTKQKTSTSNDNGGAGNGLTFVSLPLTVQPSNMKSSTAAASGLAVRDYQLEAISFLAYKFQWYISIDDTRSNLLTRAMNIVAVAQQS